MYSIEYTRTLFGMAHCHGLNFTQYIYNPSIIQSMVSSPTNGVQKCHRIGDPDVGGGIQTTVNGDKKDSYNKMQQLLNT